MIVLLFFLLPICIGTKMELLFQKIPHAMRLWASTSPYNKWGRSMLGSSLSHCQTRKRVSTETSATSWKSEVMHRKPVWTAHDYEHLMVFYTSNNIKPNRAATNKHKNANKNSQQPHFCTVYMNSFYIIHIILYGFVFLYYYLYFDYWNGFGAFKLLFVFYLHFILSFIF